MGDHLHLGGIEVTRITDMARFPLALDFLLPGAALAALEPHRDALSGDHVDFSTGEVLLGMQSLLVRTGGLVILIDTCVGECKPRRRAEWDNRRASGYIAALARAGVRPEEVDLVLCTHLHADHVGWNTRLEDGRWVPTFPKARYVFGRTECDHWRAAEAVAPGAANHGAWADSVLPVLAAGQADLVGPGDLLAAGLKVTDLAGHSPGQIGVEIVTGEGPASFCGDAIHSPVQVFHPGWASRFCADPARAVATRVQLLERAVAEDLLLFPAHLRGALAMRIRRRGDGFAPLYL